MKRVGDMIIVLDPGECLIACKLYIRIIIIVGKWLKMLLLWQPWPPGSCMISLYKVLNNDHLCLWWWWLYSMLKQQIKWKVKDSTVKLAVGLLSKHISRFWFFQNISIIVSFSWAQEDKDGTKQTINNWTDFVNDIC